MARHYRQEAGDRGEELALRYLETAGLTLLQRNYRCNNGEIDLVMRDGAVLVLVEVRYRRNSRFGGAAASVGSLKQQRLLRAAQHLLQTNRTYRQLQARFDLVAIEGEGTNVQLNWIKDAFRQ